MDSELYDTLDGRVAPDTGANRGIGPEIAHGLAELGATVYGGVRDPTSLSTPDIRPVWMDVTEMTTIESALGTVANEVGRLDVLVNNARIAPGAGRSLAEEPIEEIDEVLAVHLKGPIIVTKRSLPLLQNRSGARIANVSSGRGALDEGMSGGAPASRISKSGLNALTVHLHGEFGEELVVNAVCPGGSGRNWADRTRLDPRKQGRKPRSGCVDSNPEAGAARSGGTGRSFPGERSPGPYRTGREFDNGP